MQLFRGRVLSACGVAVLLWSLLAFRNASVILYIAAGVTAGVLPLLFFFLRRGGKCSAYRFFSVLAAAVIFLLFLARTAFFYFGTYRNAMQYVGEAHRVTCCVTERQNFTGYSSRYAVRVQTVDGETVRTRGLLSCHFASDYPVGTVLEIHGALVGDAGEAYPGNVSDGILYTLDAVLSSDTSVVGEEPTDAWRTEMRSRNRRLSSRIRQTVGGAEGKLCACMLLGGNDMEEDLRRDFRRAGVSHLLAISGMHLSLLCAALQWGLLRLRLGKTGRILVISIFVVLYLFLLDFPASAVRAGVMLLLSYAIGIFGGDTDGITSLFLALSVILFVTPTAILDCGLLLSACATFGILSLTPVCREWAERYAGYLKKRPTRVGKRRKGQKLAEKTVSLFLKKVLPAIAVIFGANMMTSVPVAFLFGKASVVTPVSNLIAPLPAEAAMLLTVLSLLFPEGSFLQGMCAYYAKKCAGFLLWLTRKLSDIRGAEFSLRAPFLRAVLILATAATLLLLCVRLRHRVFVAAPFLAAVLCMVCYAGWAVPDTVHVFFTEAGTEDAMVAVAHGTAVLADFTSGSGRTLSDAAALGEEAGATEIEALLLTHYHARHVGTVERLLLQQKVRRLWLPEPRTSDDASVFLRLCDVAKEQEIECRVYAADEPFVIFRDLTLRASGPERIARSTHPVLSLQLSDGSRTLFYWGKSAEENGTLLSRLSPDAGTALILGNHGPVQKKASAETLSSGGSLHIFSEEKLRYLTGGRDPAPWLGKIVLHEKTAYFRLGG